MPVRGSGHYWSQPASACGSSIHLDLFSGKKPRSETSLPAAPIKTETMGAGTTLQPAARQEASQ